MRERKTALNTTAPDTATPDNPLTLPFQDATHCFYCDQDHDLHLATFRFKHCRSWRAEILCPNCILSLEHEGAVVRFKERVLC